MLKIIPNAGAENTPFVHENYCYLSLQGNLKHVLPHMETILKDYKTMKERTQSRDEMLKTLDTALRRSEGRSRALRDELQDMKDENKCLREKAQQNESILR